MNALIHPDVDHEQRQRVADRLEEDERLVFLSRFGKQREPLWLLIVFGALWLAISLGFLGAAISDASAITSAWWTSPVVWFTLPFIATGVGIIGAYPVIKRKIRRSVFGLTNRRIITSLPQKTLSTPLEEIMRFVVIEHADGTGTVRLDARHIAAHSVQELLALPVSRYVSGSFTDIRRVDQVLRSCCLPGERTKTIAADGVVDPGLRRDIESWLDPGEQILWAERPGKTVLYALTNKRALSIQQRRSGRREIISYPADRLEIIGQIRRSGGSTDLVLRCQYSVYDHEITRKEGFKGLRDASGAKRVIHSIRQTYRNM